MSASQPALLVIVALLLLVTGALIGRMSTLSFRQLDGSSPERGPAAEPVVPEATRVTDAPGVTDALRAQEPVHAGGAEQEGHDNSRVLAVRRLTQALDSIEQGVILFDSDGSELLRNRVAHQYAEARGPLVLVEAAVKDLLQGALEGHREWREVDLFGPPAQSFLVEVLPLAGEVEGGGAMAIVDDRSLQRRTETVRRDFVANISHELKTPIGALGLLAETIRDEPDTEVVGRLADRMIVEAERASDTVDDLLELSRIEFGDETDFEEIPLLAVVGEANSRIASAAEHAGIEVEVDLSADLRIIGDRRQLVSALFNLLDNAVKYSPDGSTVVVSGERWGGGMRLTVADTGIGIPRRDLDRIFERFYRVDRARSRRTGGTGLGLAIVRHVMSNHGGEVSVESTEGVGSVFTLTFTVTGES